METVKLTVMIDEQSDECLYVGEHAWDGRGERTVYVSDLMEHAAGKLIELKHVSCVRSFGGVKTAWPDTLTEAMTMADPSQFASC